MTFSVAPAETGDCDDVQRGACRDRGSVTTGGPRTGLFVTGRP